MKLNELPQNYEYKACYMSEFNSGIILNYDESDDSILCYPCCFYSGKRENAFHKFKFDELSNIDNIIDYLTPYYNKAIYSLHPICKNLYNTEDDKICILHDSDNKIKNIDVSFLPGCNIRCSMCKINHSQNLNHLKTAYFNILYSLKNKSLNTISLTQMGEPFLFKSETFDYLKQLTLNDTKSVKIVSNLTLLNENDIVELSKCNVCIKILASISGIKPDTYKIIHNNDNFDKVIENAILLKKLNMLFHINVVVQDYNINELQEIYDFWHGLNVHINFIPVDNKPIDEMPKLFEFLKNNHLM